MKIRTRRRLYPLVDRSLQYKFLVMILFYGIIIVAFLALTMFVPDIITMNNKNLSLEIRVAAAEKVLFLHSRVWPSIVALICLLGIHSFRVFLRVVGPLFRFRWAFARVERGYLNFRVRLRKKDHLRQEAKLFNAMIEVMAEKWGKMQKAGLEALQSFEALEESMAKIRDWQKFPQQLLKTHRKNLESLLGQVQYFELKSGEKEKEKAAS